MRIFTTSFQLLSHSHASAVAFIACTHSNLHSSIVPEILSSDSISDQLFLTPDSAIKWFSVFILSDTMQFSSLLKATTDRVLRHVLHQVLPHLINNNLYFTRALQQCVLACDTQVQLSLPFLQELVKVRSLTKLDFITEVNYEHITVISQIIDLQHLTITNFSSSTKYFVAPTPASKISFPRLRELVVHNSTYVT